MERTYYPVFSIMKIRILRSVLVEIEKPRLSEVWDKQLYRGSEMHIEKINVDGKFANLITYEGDVVLQIPTDAYEVIV